jgi:hypothetical protein
MVCEKCQKKLGTVACPDKWKDGATNTTGALLTSSAVYASGSYLYSSILSLCPLPCPYVHATLPFPVYFYSIYYFYCIYFSLFLCLFPLFLPTSPLYIAPNTRCSERLRCQLPPRVMRLFLVRAHRGRRTISNIFVAIFVSGVCHPYLRGRI